MTKTLESSVAIDHASILESLAIPYMAYEAQSPYRIIDENTAHERVAFTRREDVIGKPFLEAFPDTSEEFKRTGKSAPIESIKKIVRTRKPDSLGEFSWDVTDESGQTITKHWRSTQYPIFDENRDTVVAVYQLTEDITEEVRTEQALEMTQRKLIEVLAAGRIGTWSLDMKQQVVKGGPNLSRMFEFEPVLAAQGLSLQDFLVKIHEDDRSRVTNEIQAAIESGDFYETEYRIVKEDGSIRWVLARGQLKPKDLDGTNSFEDNSNIFSGTLIDITERKTIEQEMNKSEARLRLMGDSMPQLIWIADSQGRGEYFNRQWYEFTGADTSSDSVQWSDYIHPDDRNKVDTAWKRAVRTGSNYELKYRLYHAPTGRYRWVIVRALPTFNDDGKVGNWYGTCTDIDEQEYHTRQQEFLSKISKELASSMNIVKTLAKITKLSVPSIADWCSVDVYSEEKGFEQVSVAHSNPKKLHQAIEYREQNPLTLDDDASLPRILKTGKAEFYPVITEEMIEAGIDASEPDKLAFMKSLNLKSIMVVPLKDGKKTIGAITFVSSDSGRYFDEDDFMMASELGARVSLSVTNARMYADSQQDLKYRRELEKQLRQEKRTLESRVKERTSQLQLTNQGLRDEITRRQSIEQELNAYSAELTRSNKELEDFAYVASHDLQEPLRKIQAFGNLLLGEYGDSLGIEGADYLQRMHSAASRMSTLIEDLLTFSRVGRSQNPIREVDLNSVMTDVTSDLEARISDTGATVNVGKLPVVQADPTHMRQLFQNLVGNAIKFHRPNVAPVVTLASKAKRGGYEITVSDNGVGFDEKYLDRIFAVFQRLHERSSYEGTGIGLAVCRKIVERYGGTITAESTKNKGSTFIMWLPATTKKKKKED